jgi:hypothetical protein
MEVSGQLHTLAALSLEKLLFTNWQEAVRDAESAWTLWGGEKSLVFAGN